MPNNNTNNSNIEKLPGVIVEDITELVEFYIAHLPTHPITNQVYTAEEITAVMCKWPENKWHTSGHDCLYMYNCLLLETISNLRLDAIQQTNSIKEIATICRDTEV